MRGSFKIWLGVAAAALIVAVVAPAVQAQCLPARIFGGDGGTMLDPKLNVLTNGTANAGTAIGYFWENGNPANDNHTGVGCPSSVWWVLAGPDRRVAGAIGSISCQIGACLTNPVLNLVVEDPYLDGSNANFIMFRVDETPAGTRYYDHARVTPGYNPTGGGTFSVNMEPFPTVDVSGSVGPPPGTTVTNSYANLGVSFRGVSGPAHTPIPASSGIKFYDILAHHGAAPPARARGSWNQGVIAQVPYADAAVAGHQVPVPCPNATNSTYLGVGVEFVDGVKSALVGAHTQVACDPNIADPDDKQNKLRPKSRSKASPVR
jgi:hypothetical protein